MQSWSCTGTLVGTDAPDDYVESSGVFLLHGEIVPLKAWLKSLDRNELTYWMGLLMLFGGLSFHVSIATALIVTGAVIAAESVITSYLAVWMSGKKL